MLACWGTSMISRSLFCSARALPLALALFAMLVDIAAARETLAPPTGLTSHVAAISTNIAKSAKAKGSARAEQIDFSRSSTSPNKPATVAGSRREIFWIRPVDVDFKLPMGRVVRSFHLALQTEKDHAIRKDDTAENGALGATELLLGSSTTAGASVNGTELFVEEVGRANLWRSSFSRVGKNHREIEERQSFYTEIACNISSSTRPSHKWPPAVALCRAPAGLRRIKSRECAPGCHLRHAFAVVDNAKHKRLWRTGAFSIP